MDILWTLYHLGRPPLDVSTFLTFLQYSTVLYSNRIALFAHGQRQRHGHGHGLGAWDWGMGLELMLELGLTRAHH